MNKWRQYVGFEQTHQAAANTVVGLVVSLSAGAAVAAPFLGTRFGPAAGETAAVTGGLGFTLVVFYLLVSFIVYVVERRSAKLAEAFFAADSDPSYLTWMSGIFDQIYGSKIQFSLFGQTYRALCLPAAADHCFEAPRFKDLFDTNALEVAVKHYETADKGQAQMVSEYSQLIGPTAPYADRLGFFVRCVYRANCGGVLRVATGVTTFWDTLKSTHALSYELWQLYRRCKGTIPRNPLEHLPIRRRFHDGREDLADIACQPISDCISHVGIQILVAQFDETHAEWQFAMMKRSKNVVGKRGYYQFPPSGQFELFNYTMDCTPANLKKQFEVSETIFREFAEEIFGIHEYQDNQDKPFSDIRSEKHVAELLQLLARDEASLDFIGLVVGPEILRHEFAFLLTIRGKRGTDWVPQSGVETEKGTLEFFSLAELVGRFDPAEPAKPASLLHEPSAGLFNLALRVLIERGIVARKDEPFARYGCVALSGTNQAEGAPKTIV